MSVGAMPLDMADCALDEAPRPTTSRSGYESDALAYFEPQPSSSATSSTPSAKHQRKNVEKSLPWRYCIAQLQRCTDAPNRARFKELISKFSEAHFHQRKADTLKAARALWPDVEERYGDLNERWYEIETDLLAREPLPHAFVNVLVKDDPTRTVPIRAIRRVNGVCRSHHEHNVREVRDPRSRSRRSSGVGRVAMPKYFINDYNARAPSRREVAFLELNDNVNLNYLQEFCGAKGRREVIYAHIYKHPRTSAHMGMALVQFKTTDQLTDFIEQNGNYPKILGFHAKIFVDTLGLWVVDEYMRQIGEKPPALPPRQKHLKKEAEIERIKSLILRQNKNDDIFDNQPDVNGHSDAQEGEINIEGSLENQFFAKPIGARTPTGVPQSSSMSASATHSGSHNSAAAASPEPPSAAATPKPSTPAPAREATPPSTRFNMPSYKPPPIVRKDEDNKVNGNNSQTSGSLAPAVAVDAIENADEDLPIIIRRTETDMGPYWANNKEERATLVQAAFSHGHFDKDNVYQLPTLRLLSRQQCMVVKSSFFVEPDEVKLMGRDARIKTIRNVKNQLRVDILATLRANVCQAIETLMFKEVDRLQADYEAEQRKLNAERHTIKEEPKQIFDFNEMSKSAASMSTRSVFGSNSMWLLNKNIMTKRKIPKKRRGERHNAKRGSRERSAARGRRKSGWSTPLGGRVETIISTSSSGSQSSSAASSRANSPSNERHAPAAAAASASSPSTASSSSDEERASHSMSEPAATAAASPQVVVASPSAVPNASVPPASLHDHLGELEPATLEMLNASGALGRLTRRVDYYEDSSSSSAGGDSDWADSHGIVDQLLEPKRSKKAKTLTKKAPVKRKNSSEELKSIKTEAGQPKRPRKAPAPLVPKAETELEQAESTTPLEAIALIEAESVPFGTREHIEAEPEPQPKMPKVELQSPRKAAAEERTQSASPTPSPVEAELKTSPVVHLEPPAPLEADKEETPPLVEDQPPEMTSRVTPPPPAVDSKPSAEEIGPLVEDLEPSLKARNESPPTSPPKTTAIAQPKPRKPKARRAPVISRPDPDRFAHVTFARRSHAEEHAILTRAFDEEDAHFFARAAQSKRLTMKRTCADASVLTRTLTVANPFEVAEHLRYTLDDWLGTPQGAARLKPYVRGEPKTGPFVPMLRNGFIAVTSKDQRAARTRQEKRRELRAIQRNLVSSVGDCPSLRQNMFKFREKMLKFARSDIHGWGLFTLEDIQANDMIIEYIGERIRSTVADAREEQYVRRGIGSSYLFRIDEDTVIDATAKGNVARFINHSCNPNCYARVIGRGDERVICIYAKRQIYKGEECTYDYKFPSEPENAKIACHCYAENCRQYLN